MLNTITQDVLTIIFSYLDYDVLKIPLLSQYFRKYFDNSKNHICHKIFKNNYKLVNFDHSYMVYKSLIFYNINLKHDDSDYDSDDDSDYGSDNSDYDKLVIYEIIQDYLYESVMLLLNANITNDTDISISIIDNILTDREYYDYEKFNSILTPLMEFLFSGTNNTNKKIKILVFLINRYHIDIHDFNIYYNSAVNITSLGVNIVGDVDIELLWFLLVNNHVDLEKCPMMEYLLVDEFFSCDDRIIILRDKYHVTNILQKVRNLEKFVLILIYNSEVKELAYIVKNFGLDLNVPPYFMAVMHSNDSSLLWNLSKVGIYMYV